MKLRLVEERRAAVQCFLQGKGYKATAREINVPVSAVREWRRLWQTGEFMADDGLVGRSPSKQRRIQELCASGCNPGRIAELLGCSVSTVKRYLSRMSEAVNQLTFDDDRGTR